TSFLIGIAQQEGRLSISDTTSNIIGQGWTNCTPAQENKITIRHQLTMTSGLDDGVPDNHCFKDSCLIYKTDAGTRWAYHNGPYTILDSVINISTGLTLNQYATQKIKNPIGMTGAFVTTGSDHVYFSNARSMARFGLLILNKGNWNGTQLLTDTNYYNQMLNSSQSLNKSYGYLWWLNGKSSFMVPSAQMVFPGSLCPNAPSNMIAAMGKNGQFINIVPDKKLVWIRMGNSPENSLVPFFLDDDIWKYINKLECNTTFVKPLETTSFKVNYYLYPNTNSLTVRANQPLSNFKIITLQGQVVKDIFLKNNELETTLSINDLVNGLYFINITSINGDKFAGKMLKQ
ncbi:MAG: serine hydrolase, partial [Bacteroidia bacterium]|nr:serine hydrolase [Bacteroidia bacterium]